MAVTELKQAVEATDEVTAKDEKAADDIFQPYGKLLFVNARYACNKISQDQTTADPYTDLQGLTRKKGPMGLSRKTFNDCVMFDLLTMFPTSEIDSKVILMGHEIVKLL